MKLKIKIFACILLALSSLPLFSQNLGSIMYKTVIIDGEEVIRLLVVYEVTQYDQKGRETQVRNLKWGETLTEYDKKGRVVYSCKNNSSGKVEFWVEFGPDDNMIRRWGNVLGQDFEEWYEYDSKGHVIHLKQNNGYEERHEYDSKGNQVHYRNSSGKESWSEYDSKGHVLKKTFSDGSFESFEYDSKGNEIHYTDSNGNETWFEYDSKNRLVYTKYSPSGNEVWCEYDSKGNLIHEKWLYNNYEYWKTYDKKGREIYTKYSAGAEYWMEYEFYPNGKVKSKTTYFIMNEM